MSDVFGVNQGPRPNTSSVSHARPFKQENSQYGNDAKCFGFITPDEGGEDLFAHFSSVQTQGFKTLKEGQKVSFDVVQGPKGKQASNIHPEG